MSVLGERYGDVYVNSFLHTYYLYIYIYIHIHVYGVAKNIDHVSYEKQETTRC